MCETKWRKETEEINFCDGTKWKRFEEYFFFLLCNAHFSKTFKTSKTNHSLSDIYFFLPDKTVFTDGKIRNSFSTSSQFINTGKKKLELANRSPEKKRKKRASSPSGLPSVCHMSVLLFWRKLTSAIHWVKDEVRVNTVGFCRVLHPREETKLVTPWTYHLPSPPLQFRGPPESPCGDRQRTVKAAD